MFYRRIRDLREDSDLSQRQLAEYLRCTQQTYSNYELGRHDIPTEVLIRLARFYQTTTDYLLGLTDYPGIPAMMRRARTGGTSEIAAGADVSQPSKKQKN